MLREIASISCRYCFVLLGKKKKFVNFVLFVIRSQAVFKDVARKCFYFVPVFILVTGILFNFLAFPYFNLKNFVYTYAI